jgi:hypothetical protein
MRERFFGQFLIQQGVLTPLQLAEGLLYQQRVNRSIGTIAVEKKYLIEDEVWRILEQQRSCDLPFGEIGKRLSLLTPRQHRLLLKEQERSTIYLGETLLVLGYLTGEQYAQYLSDFRIREEAVLRDIETALTDKPALKVVLATLMDIFGRCTDQPMKIESIGMPAAPEQDSWSFTLRMESLECSVLLSIPVQEQEKLSSLFPEGGVGFCRMLSDYLPARLEAVGLGPCRCALDVEDRVDQRWEELPVSLITPSSRFQVLFRTPEERS